MSKSKSQLPEKIFIGGLVWHHRASNDACHKIEKSSQRGCCQSGKNLFLTIENQGILPLQKADVPI